MSEALARGWSPLSAGARELLAACSVFRGGFSAEAAEAVFLTGPTAVVPDLLEELTSASLLRIEAARGIWGEVRFSVPGLVRELALARLERSGRRDQVADARDAHLIATGSGWARQGRAREELRRLALDEDNLVGVAEDALRAEATPATATRALEAASILEPRALRRTPAAFGDLLGRALQHAERAGLSVETPRLLRARLMRASALGLSDAVDQAVSLGLEVLEAAGRTADAALEAEALLHLGDCEVRRGRLADGRARLEAGMRRAEQGELAATSVRLRASLGATLSLVGATRAAGRRELERARTLALRLGDELTAGLALGALGRASAQDGALAAARACLEEALVVARDLDDERLEGTAASDLTCVLARQGLIPEAVASHERALAAHQAVGDDRAEAVALARRGLLLHLAGRLDEAEDALEPLHIELRKSRRDLCSLALAQLSALAADRGDVARAAERLARARDIGGAASLLMVHRAHLELARMREAVAAGDRRSAHAHRAEAARCARLGRAALDADGTPWADELRLAVQVLDRSLAARATPDLGLIAADDFALLVLPNGARVDLTRRAVLRNVVAELVRARAEEPEGATTDDLLEAGWPGERIARRAATNRLYVALATLRDLGLRDLLERTRSGWRLDPGVPLVVVPRRDLE